MEGDPHVVENVIWAKRRMFWKVRAMPALRDARAASSPTIDLPSRRIVARRSAGRRR